MISHRALLVGLCTGIALVMPLAATADFALARAYLGEAYLMKIDLPAAQVQLSEIARRCGTGCEALARLAANIATYKTNAAHGG